MEFLRKLGDMAQLALYVLGVIGGLGWTLFEKSYVIAAGVLALGVMAFPHIKGVFKRFIDA